MQNVQFLYGKNHETFSSVKICCIINNNYITALKKKIKMLIICFRNKINNSSKKRCKNIIFKQLLYFPLKNDIFSLLAFSLLRHVRRYYQWCLPVCKVSPVIVCAHCTSLVSLRFRFAGSSLLVSNSDPSPMLAFLGELCPFTFLFNVSFCIVTFFV